MTDETKKIRFATCAACEELTARVERLERAIVNLARATQDWRGGAYDGAAYTDGRWRDAVLKAVREIAPPQERETE